jgi:Cof subfamily protein (haloacid dehalogenase superfamily)
VKSIKLVLADVDGTLLTREKLVTVQARQAVIKLCEAGVAFAITSGRPPRGMEMLITPLKITTPIAAFNGGVFVRPDLSLIEQRVLQPPVVAPVIEIIKMHRLDVWIYRGTEWFVPERHGLHVDREERTVKFPPTVVPNFDGKMDNVAKIVGVSDDLDAVATCEQTVREQFANNVRCQQSNPGRESPPAVSAARSQPYYLDVTHPDANKGAVVLALSKMLSIPANEIATIGDMPNDMTMFAKSGLSIAMGQSSDEVKAAATYVTTSSEQEGFANAMERYVLALRNESA